MASSPRYELKTAIPQKKFDRADFLANTTTISSLFVWCSAVQPLPTYYQVIYTYDTSAASGLAPFKFF
jgi:hypothetical protein